VLIRRGQRTAIGESWSVFKDFSAIRGAQAALLNDITKLSDEDLDCLEDLIHRVRELRKPFG
jgi:hypothetical protein